MWFHPFIKRNLKWQPIDFSPICCPETTYSEFWKLEVNDANNFYFLDKILDKNQVLSFILSNDYGTMTLVKDLALIF